MKLDPDLEDKLTKTALFWPRGKPGLEDELKQIAKDYEDTKTAWRKLGPLVVILALLAIWLALTASGQL